MREIWAAPQVPIPTPEPSPPHDVVTENGVSRSAEAASVHTEAVQQEDVMGEDVSKRDTFSKEFVLKNGMRARMISSTPLHYQQGARWEAYDNTLQEIKQNGKTQKWVNKKNPTRIELPAGVSQAEEIVLARDGKRVALQLQGVQQGKGQGAQKRMENALAKGLGSAQKKMQQQDKSKAGMRYSNVWKDIDIEYELVGEALKENIILQKKQQKNLTLRYRLNLEGLRPQVEKDGSILLFDSAQKQEDAAPVFVLPAPWMIDQQGETSYDIAVALTPKTQRALTLQQGGDNLQDDAQEDQPQDNLQEEPQTNAPQAQQPSGETEQDPSQQEEPVPQDPTPSSVEQQEPGEVPQPGASAPTDPRPSAPQAETTALQQPVASPAQMDVTAQAPAQQGEDDVPPQDTPPQDVPAGTAQADAQQLEPSQDAIWEIVYTPQDAWLRDSARVYPVVIDPVIMANRSAVNVHDNELRYRYPDQNTKLVGSMAVGWREAYHSMRFLVKFNELPKLEAADIVVNAQINLYKPLDSSTDMPVSVHKLNANWNTDTVTWNNQPPHNSIAEDIRMVKNAGWHTWDITSIARDWYTVSDNRGMLFRAVGAYEGTPPDNFRQFYASDYSASASPYLYIYYINNCGLEPYWDTHTQDMGRSGTLHVNDFTGNLIYTHEDIGYGGSRMPVSIRHIYNANDKNNNMFSLGPGFRTNYHQRVTPVTIDGTQYYKWEDEDGTRQYFKLKDGAYKDEMDQGFTLTLNQGGYAYTITGKYGDKLRFDGAGRLVRLEDNQQSVSSAVVTYRTSGNTNAIDRITDGAGRVYRFEYNAGGGHLSAIKYYGTGSTVLDSVSFATSNSSNLTSITYNDGVTTYIDYHSNTQYPTPHGNQLGRIYNNSESFYVYIDYNNYNAPFFPARVAAIRQCPGDVQKASMSISYQNNQTTFTDHRGRQEIKQFNYYGNTTSVRDHEGRAYYAQYANNEPGSAGKMNQLNTASAMQASTVNLLMNGNAERNEYWVNSNTAHGVGYTTAEKYMGNRAIMLSGVMYEPSWEFLEEEVRQPVVVKPGKPYTFSSYVRQDRVDSPRFSATTNAKLRVRVYVNGALQQISESNEIDVEHTWKRLETTITTPNAAGTVSLEVCLVYGAGGGASFDCMQVEEGTAAGRYSLVDNGDFWHSNGGVSGDCKYWYKVGKDTGGDTRVVPYQGMDGMEGSVYRVYGEYDNKHYLQEINVSGKTGDAYSFGGWGKAHALPVGNTARRFSMSVIWRYTDGTTEEVFAYFNDSTDEWQFIMGKAVAKKDYSRIDIALHFCLQGNEAWFDGVQMFRDEFGASYVYDAKGNVVSVKDKTGKDTQYQYDGSDNLTKMILPDNKQLTYTYDNYHNATTASLPGGIKYSFTYDAYGNNTQITQQGASASDPKIIVQASYSANGNDLVSVTDEHGKTTAYSVDAQRGWTNSVQDAGGQSTAYTYDARGRTSKVSRATDDGSVANDYTYAKDLIATLSHSNASPTVKTQYAFTYNDYGLKVQSKVGGAVLASNTYDTYNRLVKVAYANGDAMGYAYNAQDQVTETRVDGESAARYGNVYDKEGRLVRSSNGQEGYTEALRYDLIGRLRQVDGRQNSAVWSYGLDYNDNDELSRMWYTRGSEAANAVNYTYDSSGFNTGANYTHGSTTISQQSTIDGYGRTGSMQLKKGSAVLSSAAYTYASPAPGRTSTRVLSLRNQAGSYDRTLSYTYDAVGNITSVSDGTHTTHYTYDDLYQLVREDNQAAGKTWVWTYDLGGNIKSRVEYSYTTGAVSVENALDTVVYAYGDANWPDKLTGYDGQAITRDAIGNPMSDGEWTYSWEGGRRLSGMSKAGTSLSYAYDASGIRTSKTVNGVKTRYTLMGSLVAYEQTGSEVIYYYYDAVGRPMSMRIGSAQYHYVYNLQGDVIGLVDNTGAVVVEYTYDAWGKPLSVTGSLAGTVGKKNPYRYRGYRYDEETGFYYLQSRYYDPEMGRFINEDKFAGFVGSIGDHNVFAYCWNNPVMYTDLTGHYPTGFYGYDYYGNPIEPYEVTLYKAKKALRDRQKAEEDARLAKAAIQAPMIISRSVDINVGFGVGAGGKASVLIGGVPVAVEVIGKADFISVQRRNGNAYVGASWDLGVSTGVGRSTASGGLGNFYPYLASEPNGKCPHCENMTTNPFAFGVGFGAYNGYGASGSIDFNISHLSHELTEILY
nr:DNRLRE domain-containing protein [Maliibacterium massiliense]